MNKNGTVIKTIQEYYRCIDCDTPFNIDDYENMIGHHKNMMANRSLMNNIPINQDIKYHFRFFKTAEIIEITVDEDVKHVPKT